MLVNKKAQSTFEYIILVTAVIAIVYAFVAVGDFDTKVEKVLDDAIGHTAGVADDIDFPDEPGVAPAPDPDDFLGTPPEGWEEAEFHCYGSLPSTIGFQGLDENGLPIFSQEYIGNYCVEEGVFTGATPEGPPPNTGKLRFDHNGNLLLGTSSGSWVPFDWNNQFHVIEAYQRQRYGPWFKTGCGIGGHGTDFLGAFENVFGREGTCTEIRDHYFGHTRTRLEGLTGDLAQYNGMTLMDANMRKRMMDHYLDPDSPRYFGTPGNPGDGFKHLDRDGWLRWYDRAVRVGVGHLLPFTRSDIDEAFPPEDET